MSAVTEEVAPEAAEDVTVDRMAPDGTAIAKVALDRSVFGLAPNVPLMHQVVSAQLAARRAGTQSTRTRAEVSGGGKKPYRQKGTGRARQGSTRAPHWSGGGVALGPKPRKYDQRTPKKMVQQALRCALSDRAAEGRVILVSAWDFEIPRTKDAARHLDELGAYGRILVVLEREDVIAERSFDNLAYVDLVEDAQLTAYDVLCSDVVIFTDASIPGEVRVLETYEVAPKEDKAEVAETPAKGRRTKAKAAAAVEVEPAEAREDGEAEGADEDADGAEAEGAVVVDEDASDGADAPDDEPEQDAEEGEQ